MFARRLNDLRLTLVLQPESPLLIKDGRHQERGERERRFFHRGTHVTRTPAQPRRRDGKGIGEYDTASDCFDMACVYSSTGDGDRFYLPGSSLRGVMRQTAEQIIGRWRPDLVRRSDPFANHGGTQVEALRKAHQSPGGADIYRMAGPLERCFGHTALKGRWQIGDAWIRQEPQAQVALVVRDGVGIDRQTGAAATNVKFQFEALTHAVFTTQMVLVNYETWHLGLLAHVLVALDRGDARLGYGTRRGLGRMRVGVTEMTWRWYGMEPAQHAQGIMLPTLHDLTQRANMPGNYGVRESSEVVVLPLVVRRTPLGVDGTLREQGTSRPAHADMPVDWAASPWREMGPLLPPVIEEWSDETGGD